MYDQIYWVGTSLAGRIGIALRPRDGDWLNDDIRVLRTLGVEVLVSALTRHEAEELGLEERTDQMRTARIGVRFFRDPGPGDSGQHYGSSPPD